MRTQIGRVIALIQLACVFLVAVALTACGGHTDVKKVSDEAIGSVRLANINSAQTGAVYPIYIYLPASYASGTATYPVIYATDGDASFPPEGRFVNFAKILQRRGIDAILVGVGGTARRDKDYVLPGAVAYHEFLTQELIPFIDSHFRADPQRRILSGISLGGSFVVTALFLEAPKTLFFSHYVSAEGSFFQPSFVAQEQRLSSTLGNRSIPATLILARGAASRTQDLPFPGSGGGKCMSAGASPMRSFAPERTNHVVVDSLYRQLTHRHYADLTLVETDFGTDHIGTDNPSFEDAMTRIFK